jgi:hypothetical protein
MDTALVNLNGCGNASNETGLSTSEVMAAVAGVVTVETTVVGTMTAPVVNFMKLFRF